MPKHDVITVKLTVHIPVDPGDRPNDHRRRRRPGWARSKTPLAASGTYVILGPVYIPDNLRRTRHDPL